MLKEGPPSPLKPIWDWVLTLLGFTGPVPQLQAAIIRPIEFEARAAEQDISFRPRSKFGRPVSVVQMRPAADVHSYVFNPGEDRESRYRTFDTLLDQTEGQAIWYAAFLGKYSRVEELLKRGVSPNILDWQGVPPVVSSIYSGYHSVLELLLVAGGDPNLAVRPGLPPLAHAILYGDWKSVEILLRHGANPNQHIDVIDNTVLGAALNSEQVEIAKRLIIAGGNYYHAARNMGRKDLRKKIRKGCPWLAQTERKRRGRLKVK